ncbi:hypothetical protein GQ54DRAFT_294708 [Martensiomyces pterosporus]|nr:hypothetical protein GQ54DRAFT_294708 [Martensiomyces pterosporus]
MHISSLSPSTHYRIIAIAYHDARKNDTWFALEDYRAFLQVASVCRAWREYALPFIYSTALVSWSAVESPKSNIGLIIDNGYSYATRELLIQSVRVDIDYSDMLNALAGSNFGSVSWPLVRKLGFLGDINPVRPYDGSPFNILSAENPLSSYLVENLPNIIELRYQPSIPMYTAAEFPFSGLFNAYLPLLQRLDARAYVAPRLTHTSFCALITHLTISLNLEHGAQLPLVLAPALRHLRLFAIPGTVPWQRFVSPRGGAVCFENLEHLILQFVPNSMHALVPDTPPGIEFPRLKKLEVVCLQDDGGFYAQLARSPLKEFYFSGSVESLQHVPSSIIGQLSRLSIACLPKEDSLEDSLENDEAMKGCQDNLARLLGTPSTVRHATLKHPGSLAVSLPSNLEWKDVQRLELELCVSLLSVVTVLRQLPRLQYLSTSGISVNTCGSDIQGPDCNAPGNKLAELIIFWETDDVPTDTLIDCLSVIAPLTPSLVRLSVPSASSSELKEHISNPENALTSLLSCVDIFEF